MRVWTKVINEGLNIFTKVRKNQAVVQKLFYCLTLEPHFRLLMFKTSYQKQRKVCNRSLLG